MKRPILVTISCVIILILSCFYLISFILIFIFPLPEAQMEEIMEFTNLPLWAGYLMAAIGISISLISAIFMLKGKYLARKIFLGWIIISIVTGLIFSNIYTNLIIETLPALLCLALLYLPSSNQYFAHNTELN